jgi:hypothetical protein
MRLMSPARQGKKAFADCGTPIAGLAFGGAVDRLSMNVKDWFLTPPRLLPIVPAPDKHVSIFQRLHCDQRVCC